MVSIIFFYYTDNVKKKKQRIFPIPFTFRYSTFYFWLFLFIINRNVICCVLTFVSINKDILKTKVKEYAYE